MTYKSLLGKIKKIINDEDPLGLIAIGTPTDEYDNETEKIVRILRNSQTIEDFKSKLQSIFRETFGEELNNSILEKLSKKIFSLKDMHD